MKQLIAGATVLGFATLVAAGCSGSSFTEGSSGSAGTSSDAGNSSAGASGSSTSGGTDTGGTDTGGTTTGGTTTGGTTTGGTTTGGSVNGGSENGGSASGGVSTGGVTTGGVSSGGATTGGSSGVGACNEDADCIDCAYPTAPLTAADCYCATCAFTPMSKAMCTANQADFAKVCANDHRMCPAIACVMPPKPACRSHKCVASQ